MVFLFLIDRLSRQKETVAPPIRMPVSTHRRMITAREASNFHDRKETTTGAAFCTEKMINEDYRGKHNNKRNHVTSCLLFHVNAVIKKNPVAMGLRLMYELGMVWAFTRSMAQQCRATPIHCS